ncbi:MAG: BglII/BstYI family type II restriction endonuclease, partial [Chloroflexota bacterium]
FIISSVHPKTETDGRISPYTLFSKFQSHFQNHRFARNRINYSVPLLNKQAQFEDTFVQIDFFKEKVMVEVQFGKYAFMFYDMAKFQYFFNERKADVGVEIVPCHALQKEMSSGVSYGEQLVYDIERLKRHFPAVPVKIILVDAELNQ